MIRKGFPPILIVCGGKGRRLGKIGQTVPKALITIKNKTILEWKLRHYLKQGCRDFIFCLGYKGNMIREAVKSFNIPATFTFSEGGEPVGILKRIYIAKKFFNDEVIVTYGDTFAEINLLKLIREHRKNKHGATIVVAPIKSPFGLVEFSLTGTVQKFDEKPILNYFIGYAVISKHALDMAPRKVIDMPDGKGIVTFFKILMSLGKLGALYYPGFQITFNTEDEVRIAREKMISFYTNKEQI
jgi:glucose-1-phosphate cytidylyltransferase